ncbi:MULTISPECIES: hypothetical protein [unclassified Gordonia (in: high G+C Gram-positive bacteria)]|uniref:hypothetical protein n=1 Tax=unclassified Gordonia (in: high G+C Gram-positive bacteria) TaxID=2657482 RepID=UPI0012E88609|nr:MULTISPECIES: hypothetical protein [unclassified Gordonia (in: high G+C Gram-positive bacteria)]
MGHTRRIAAARSSVLAAVGSAADFVDGVETHATRRLVHLDSAPDPHASALGDAVVQRFARTTEAHRTDTAGRVRPRPNLSTFAVGVAASTRADREPSTVADFRRRRAFSVPELVDGEHELLGQVLELGAHLEARLEHARRVALSAPRLSSTAPTSSLDDARRYVSDAEGRAGRYVSSVSGALGPLASVAGAIIGLAAPVAQIAHDRLDAHYADTGSPHSPDALVCAFEDWASMVSCCEGVVSASRI